MDIILLLSVRAGVQYYLGIGHQDKRKVSMSPPQVALVLSLPFRDDRRRKILDSKEMQHFNWAFFDGLHGKSLQIEAIPNDIISLPSKRSLSNGSIGAILSHQAAWKELLSTNEDIYYVFEDDVVLTADFREQVGSIWKEFPEDFDIIYLGSGISKRNDMLAMVSEKIYVPHFPRRGLYGYILSRVGAQKLLRLVFPVKVLFGGIDTVVGNLVRKGLLNAYHVDPPLCMTDETTTSNIYNPSAPDKLLHKNEL